MFVVGLGIFTVASALAALAPTTGALIAARALQGAGAAIVTPLTLTLLSTAFPPEKRGLAIGAWSGISGLGVALGPLVGGAVVDGISWQWIFWLNVPIGLALVAAGVTPAEPSRTARPAGSTCPGSALGGARPARASSTASSAAPSSAGRRPPCSARSSPASSLLAAFVAWELRAPAPMLPMRFFRSRAFSASNGVSFAMYFGVFGSIFLLAQFFQVAQGLSPLEAGLRTLPWTAMPMFVAPIAGLLSRPHRLAAADGGRPGAAGDRDRLAGASVSTPTVAYSELVVPFVLAGTGMALVFAPTANAVLERRAPGGGRPGLGRDERDPRGRRHARRRRAGLGVRAPTAPTPRRRRSPTA